MSAFRLSTSVRSIVLCVLFASIALHAEEAAAPPKTPATPATPAPAAPAGAEGVTKENPAPLEPVTVTAPMVTTPARIAQPITHTGVSVTIVDGKQDREIEQHVQLSDALRYVPGVTVGRSGFQGDFTSMFTRGGNSNQSLFLYDGFIVNRQGGNFNLGGVDPVQIERIEVARGPSSSLYGTNAVTGTVNVITAKGDGPPDLTVSAAAGTYGTDRETLQIQGREGKFSYNAGASRTHREQAVYDNSELSLYNYAARFDFDINDCHSLKAVVRGLDSHKGFYEDSGSGYGPIVDVVDPNDKLLQHDTLVGIEYKGHLLPIWDMTFRAGQYMLDYHVDSRAPNPPSNFGGFPQSTGRTYARERRPQFDWQNDITAYEDECGNVKDIVTAGASFESDAFRQEDSQFFVNVAKTRNNWSVFAQNHLELFQRAYITAGIRREENEQFGEFLTARGDVSLLIPESDTRVHGSVGSAFRAPAFYEFFSAFGNQNLKPEKNVAYDVGIEQHFWCNRITLGATWFHNSFKNLIDFNANFQFENIKEAETRGFELNAEFKPIEIFTLRGTGTIQHTEDFARQALKRRPNATYTAQALAHPIKGLDVSLDFIYEGPRRDLGPLPGNSFANVVNRSFTRLDFAASYRFLCHWRVFGRVENLLDRHYQEVKTFPSPGANFLGGVEFNWKF